MKINQLFRETRPTYRLSYKITMTS